MRKKVTSVVLLLMVLSVFLLVGCSSQIAEETQYPVQKEKLQIVLKDPDVVKTANFESVYLVNKVMGMDVGVGPSDPRYRGVLKLDEEFAEDYYKTHTWKSRTEPIPSLVNIDTKPFYSQTWYEYDDTDFDFFQNCFVNTFLFNGKDTIIFDISTT